MSRQQDHTIVWKHRLEATDHCRPGASLRSRLAWWLRRQADRLDAGRSVRLHHQTTPTLPPEEVAICITRGLEHANRLLGEFAHKAACEQSMQRTMPELFARQAEDSNQEYR